MSTSSLRKLIATILLVAAIGTLVACEVPAQYDQRGGEAIAAAIRAADSGIVEEVQFVEGDALDPASVNVVLRLGTPESEATTFVCEVVIPAIEGGTPPDDFSVSVWAGQVVATDQTDCD
jgi:hypothetical protein